MGQRRIPTEVFDVYYGLGVGRTYQAVADHYGVSKTAVFNAAKRENWAARVEEREQQARVAMDKKAVETLEQMSERHVTIAKFIQKRALEALKAMPLNDAMSAVRALDVGLKQERLIRGEPTERTAIARTEEELDALIEARREVDLKIREMDRLDDRQSLQLSGANGSPGHDE